MRYMVIERFSDAAAIYERLRVRGRMMPAGVHYLDSWVSEDLSRCFQLMEADDATRLDEWVSNWNDLMDFEVVPVISSSEASRVALAGDRLES